MKMNQKDFDIWFAEALNDFEVGKILIKSKKFNAAIFYFVQAAEKAVKALLYYSDAQPWGHSIMNLLNDYEKTGHLVKVEIKDIVMELEQYYASSRYPDALIGKSPKDAYNKEFAIEIRDKTKFVLDFIKKEKEGFI